MNLFLFHFPNPEASGSIGSGVQSSSVKTNSANAPSLNLAATLKQISPPSKMRSKTLRNKTKLLAVDGQTKATTSSGIKALSAKYHKHLKTKKPSVLAPKRVPSTHAYNITNTSSSGANRHVYKYYRTKTSKMRRPHAHKCIHSCTTHCKSSCPKGCCKGSVKVRTNMFLNLT